MNKYSLNVKDGKVEYLMEIGKNKKGVPQYVSAFTPIRSAEWMLDRGKPVNKSLPEKPDYPICVEASGKEYYFAGTWEAEKSIFDEGEKKSKGRRKNALSEEE